MLKMEKGYIDIPISKLVKAIWNYKEENEKQTQKLKNNLKRNGQIENIIVRLLDTGFYEVVNGNHRLDVLQDLGYNEVHAYNLGNISLTAAQRIAIETNETKFKSNSVKLKATLDEILSEYDLEDLQETLSVDLEVFLNIDTPINDTEIDTSDFEKEEKYTLTLKYSESEYHTIKRQLSNKGITAEQQLWESLGNE